MSSLQDTRQPYLSNDQAYALHKFKDKQNLFITGPGGTGKTKLIEHFTQYAKSNADNIQVCALTGCASVLLSHCDARTLHSWSGIRLAKGPINKIIQNVLKNRQSVSSWKKTRILIIDEVSMLSLKIFELLNQIGQTIRKDPRPFGGIQVVFTGDFYQLPPVGTPGDPDTELFCFESPLWPIIFPAKNHIELTTIFRQTDPLYRSILLEIRTNTLTQENQEILKKYVKREYDPAKYNGCVPTKLYPTRAKADFLNATMFEKIQEPEHIFECTKKTNCRTYLENNTPISIQLLEKSANLSEQDRIYEVQQLMQNSSIPDVLSLKKGAVVMCTVNLDMDQGICNGSQGIVIDFVQVNPSPSSPILVPTTCPVVRFYNGYTKTIQPHFRQSDEYPNLAVGQIPLTLAWALTIHKIQGATLALADIDVGGQIFEYGQTYVALSRVQSLDGLYLSAFHPQKIRANPKVQEFYKRIPPILPEHLTKDLDQNQLSNDVVNPFAKYECKEPDTTPRITPSINSKPKTDDITFELFKKYGSIEKVAEERGLKHSTICEHLVKHIPDPLLSVDLFMSQPIFDEISAAYRILYSPQDPSGISLKTIKESVSNKIGYDKIKIACRFLETQNQSITPNPPIDPNIKRIHIHI